MLSKISLTVTFLAFLCISARGDIVVSVVTTGPSTFDVFLQDDNLGTTVGTFGVVSYSVPLVSTGLFTLNHNSPNGFMTGAVNQNYGFDVFRSVDVTIPTSAATLTASQNTATAGSVLIPDFARFPGTLAATATANGSVLVFGEPAIPTAYGVPLLIGSGTFTGPTPKIDTSTAGLLAGNVFTTPITSGPAIGATRAANFVVAVPEPTSSVFTFSFMSILLMRRRRHFC